MDTGRSTFGVAIRLAITFSMIAALAAISIEAVADVPQTSVVLSVIIVGFVASWVLTGRASRSVGAQSRHRPTALYARQPIA